MFYKLESDEPFIRIGVDLSSVDAVELVESLTLHEGYKYTFNFYKADANDAILTYDVTGIPKKKLIDIFNHMCLLKTVNNVTPG